MRVHAIGTLGVLTLALFASATASTLPSQTTNVTPVARPPRAVRFQIGQVDSVAIVFGLDTSALRTAIEQRLHAADMLKVQAGHANDSLLPTLVLRLSVPRSLVADPSMDFLALAQLELRPARSSKHGSASRAPIWSSTGLARRFSTLRSAAESLPTMANSQLDEFIAAYGHGRQTGIVVARGEVE